MALLGMSTMQPSANDILVRTIATSCLVDKQNQLYPVA